MTTLETYIADNNLESSKEVKNIRLLFNEAVKVYRIMKSKNRSVTDHKNESVNFLAACAANLVDSHRFNLNQEVFNYRWVSETMAQLLRDEPTAQPAPWM